MRPRLLFRSLLLGLFFVPRLVLGGPFAPAAPPALSATGSLEIADELADAPAVDSSVSPALRTSSAPGTGIMPASAPAPIADHLDNLHLEDVLLLALERNRTVIGSREQVEAAEGKVAQARAIISPRLTGRFTQTRLDDVGSANLMGKTIALGKKDVQKAYVELAQPLFLGGKDRAALTSARLGRSAARSGHTFARQQVLAQTTLTWLAWLFAREVERVSRKDLELAEEHHRLVEARARHEQASKFELLRAEVRLAQARNKVRQDVNHVDLARLDLLRVLALPGELPIDTGDRLVLREFPTNLAHDASEAADLREDLRLRRYEAEIARQGLRAARGEKQPTVSLYGQAGSEDPSSKSGFGGLERKGYWNAGLAMEVPLVDGGQRQGRIREATAALALAENGLQDALEKARIEMQQALLNLETAREIVLSQEEALKQAEEALRLAGVKYANGMFTQVEMFDAENAFLNTNLQYLQAVLAHHQSRVAYQLATGKLGRDLLDRPPAR